MSVEGDGDNFFDDALNSVVGNFDNKGDFLDNLITGGINLGIQASTGGMLGYKDGKFGKGLAVETTEELGKGLAGGVKEVTGAKAAEEANAMARQQFEDQTLASEADRNNQIAMKGRQEMMASQLAGAARRSGMSSSNQSSGNILGSDGRDFLGL